ncbi:MAG TPA: DUF58 domain-containing protein [Ardenticatenaceae bacterium]
MKSIVTYMVVLLVAAVVLRIDFYVAIVYLFLAIYLLSRLWAQRLRQALRAERHFEKRAFIGDRVPVSLTLRNISWLPIPWITASETLPVELATPPFHQEALALGPKESQTLHYEVRCQRRGYYPIGPVRLQMGDLLGVVKHNPLQVEPSYLTVYPRIIPLQHLGLPTRSPLVALPARSPLFEDPSRIMGVRDYKRGDPPKRIHWTATARAGRLVVKNYQPAIARETLICLDMSEDSYARGELHSATELAIIVAASLAHHIIVEERLPVGLATEVWDPLPRDQVRHLLPPRTERAHLTQILEVLARARVTSGISFTNLLRDASLELSWGSTMTLVTGRGDSALLESLLVLRRASFAVNVILVQPRQGFAELRQHASILGVQLHQIWHEHDLETWR